MDAAQLALARSRAYVLLGDLFLQGPRPGSLPLLEAVPELAPHLPTPAELDEAAAEHHRVLSRMVFPYESVFLGDQGLMSGSEQDHIGHQLHHLAYLSGDRVQQAEIPSFLDQRLLRWLPCLALAISTVDSRLYTAAADLALNLAVDHRAQWPEDVTPWALPPAPSILDEPRAGIRTISLHLVTPALAGGFLTLATLEGIGNGLDLPPGFGRRVDVLENLFHAGARYGLNAQLLARLRLEFQGWKTALAAHQSLGLDPHTATWRARLEETDEVLQRMADALDSFLEEDRPPPLSSPPGSV